LDFFTFSVFLFFINADFLSIYLSFLHFSAERNFFCFLCRIYTKRKKAQRELWRLSEVMPFGCHEPPFFPAPDKGKGRVILLHFQL